MFLSFFYRVSRIAAAALLAGLCSGAAGPPPDSRFKADILVIIAHPDDETEVGGYLARAVLDQHKRVAVIFGTRGNSGGNAAGMEQAAALGAEREIEARRALAGWGVMNIWFLGGPDTPGQDVLRSLETWNHGNALWQAVRIVRLTRPQIILTWLPLYSAGENHGDHQAASVIATEAFDLAGDPTFFPEQVAPPRDRYDIGNLTEGLHPWQAQKLYFFSDASHSEFMDGQGPQYSNQDVSPARGVSYARLAAEEMSAHLTQGDTGQVAKDALEKGDLHFFNDPSRFVFGKSVVPSGVTDGIFQGVAAGPVPYVRAPGYQPIESSGVTAELGGPWAFYRRFWPAHGLGRLAGLLRPEVNVSAASRLSIPVLVHNHTDSNRETEVTVSLPQGWTAERGPGQYSVSAHETVPVEFFLTTPAKPNPIWQTVTMKVEVPGSPAIELPLRVNLASGSLPQ